MPANLNLKKSWHPGLLKNQKKLWKQEQDTLQEYQKIKERRKELEVEKEREEFIKLQYGDDLDNIPKEKKLQLNKLDWMYDTPSQNSSGFNEMVGEFTEGKQQVENLLSGKQALSDGKASRFEQVLSVKEKPVSKSLVADDPLMKIKLTLKSKAATRPSSNSSERRRHESNGKERRERREREHRRREKSPERGNGSLGTSHSHHHRSRASNHRSRHDPEDKERRRDYNQRESSKLNPTVDKNRDILTQPKIFSYD